MKRVKTFPAILAYIIICAIMFTAVLPAARQNKPKDYVKVYYFHGKNRCSTCIKIENLTADAMQNKFKNETASGKVIFESVDFDEKSNEHYIQKYNLYNQTLLIVQFKDGKQSKWKNAEKIWELNGNKTKFMEYVEKEVKDYLKGI